MGCVLSVPSPIKAEAVIEVTKTEKEIAIQAALAYPMVRREDGHKRPVYIWRRGKVAELVAQFGRGAMADISDKILAQFVQNLNALIASQPAVSTAATPVQTQDAGPRKIDGPIAAPINLLETAGSSIAKRAIPVLIVVAGIILYFIVK